MADGVKQSDNFYAILGLNKECTTAELRNAYKKLALKWHPDRCPTMGNSDHVEEAKKKFQGIQQAYSVLSDSNKRFLYDLGMYDSEDDDDANGMGNFLSEMASMMNQTNENVNESFEDLQQIFNDMFECDLGTFGSSCFATTPSTFFTPSSASYNDMYRKRNSSEISSGNPKVEPSKFKGFFEGAEHQEDPLIERVAGERISGRGGESRRNGRKQKILHGQDVSSSEYSSIFT